MEAMIDEYLKPCALMEAHQPHVPLRLRSCWSAIDITHANDDLWLMPSHGLSHEVSGSGTVLTPSNVEGLNWTDVVETNRVVRE
jgi:hypothetical protein